jgi:hypothetical protein
MKAVGSKWIIILTLCASPRALSLPAMWSQTGAPKIASFVGEIMDSKCATSGTHEPTMKKVDAKDARECTLKCARDASFVLYDPGTKTVYQLNDQEKPAPFAGQKVKISGMYDSWSQTIEIESIEVAAGR